MKQLKVAILGQGRSGYGIHASWLRNDTERFKIVAVADPIVERMKECAEEFGSKQYDDYKALLADKSLDADLVVNALPSHLHAEGTIAAFKAGYNVICEKPVARTVAEFDSVVAAAKGSGKLCLPYQNSRFQPAFQKIQEVLASGRLGELVHARICFNGWSRRWDWQTRRDMGGGNLLNTGPHPLDQAIVLFGEDMPQVFARLVSKNPFGDAENFASVTLWGKGKPTIDVVTSSFAAYPQGEMYNLGCTRGGLSGSLTELKWKYYNVDKAPDHPHSSTVTHSEERRFCHEDLEWTEETWKFETKRAVITNGFYDDAYGIIVNGAPRVITLEQVRRQVAVLEEAHRQNPDLR